MSEGAKTSKAAHEDCDDNDDFESVTDSVDESDSEAYRGAFDASVSENDDDMPSPTLHGDAEGELEQLSAESRRIKLRRGITMDSSSASVCVLKC